ncbi:ETC complex I subunit conserved region-domain-containing protein [Sphaerosporella brunnea]|uniref:ETC complex I subunit conserved region-domain-containing protein n=1 Tax=Sphaerosporella brunnea TaxID=1250544 RepID=A0A5J5EEN0_9PEZI|nr:ETC complex I subunit conserved region-domain-containing protein [Sphaerosporella brunnea]
MRPSTRLLTARLPPFTPTGITGVLTHPHPRPTLIALYKHTLQLLQELPAHSVYRQSTENLTKARLNTVESIKPPGFEAYAAARKQAGEPEHPELRDVAKFMCAILANLEASTSHEGNKLYARNEMKRWGPILRAAAAGASSPAPAQESQLAEMAKAEEVPELEPQLTAEQVETIEEGVGEGLIEEIIDEGWAELECAKAMLEDRVWEPLAEVPEEGQWVAYERVPSN